jgi:hypothetical protein
MSLNVDDRRWGSHWYVTPGFTTFLVFLLLLSQEPDRTFGRFAERVGETVLGVGLALVFVGLLPAPSPIRGWRHGAGGGQA